MKLLKSFTFRNEISILSTNFFMLLFLVASMVPWSVSVISGKDTPSFMWPLLFVLAPLGMLMLIIDGMLKLVDNRDPESDGRIYFYGFYLAVILCFLALICWNYALARKSVDDVTSISTLYFAAVVALARIVMEIPKIPRYGYYRLVASIVAIMIPIVAILLFLILGRKWDYTLHSYAAGAGVLILSSLFLKNEAEDIKEQRLIEMLRYGLIALIVGVVLCAVAVPMFFGIRNKIKSGISEPIDLDSIEFPRFKLPERDVTYFSAWREAYAEVGKTILLLGIPQLRKLFVDYVAMPNEAGAASSHWIENFVLVCSQITACMKIAAGVDYHDKGKALQLAVNNIEGITSDMQNAMREKGLVFSEYSYDIAINYPSWEISEMLGKDDWSWDMFCCN